MPRRKRIANPMKRTYVTRTIRWPEELWASITASIPPGERSAFVRDAVRDALLRRAAERLRRYYDLEPEAIEWAAFAGDAPSV
jgi:hypothetical protein